MAWWLLAVDLSFALGSKMAERVGFEPTEPFRAQRFSRPPDSTTLAPLHLRELLILKVGTFVIKRYPFPPKKFLNQAATLFLKYSAVDLDPMIQSFGQTYAEMRLDRAESFII